MAGAQLNNIQILDLTTGLTRTLETGGTPDVLQVETDFQLLSGANLLVDGNLVVNGTTTTVNSEQVNIRDNHLYLNADYTAAVAQTGGFVVNVLPTATVDTVGGAGFTAGVPGVSNPTVITAIGGVFSAGDIIQISDADNQANDGIFEVESHVGTTLTIRGIGTTANTQDWFTNDFVTDATATGDITLVNVNVLRGTAAGDWETYTGNTTVGLTYDTFTTQGTVDLQAAYVAGNTITTSAAEGNVSIVGDQDFVVGGSVDVNFDTTGSISLDADAASNLTVNNASLTLSTTTAGDIVVSSVADVDMDAANFLMDATVGISLDAAAASNFSVDGGDLSLATTTTGSVLVDGVGGVEINSSAGDLNLGNDAATGAINVGTGAAARTVTVGNSTGSTAVDFDAGTGAFSFDSTVGEGSALASLTTSGTNGDSVGVYVGQSDPSAAAGIVGDVGSLFMRDSGGVGTTGELWIKIGAADTDWEQVATGNTGETLQQAYENGNTITTDATNGDFVVGGTESISMIVAGTASFGAVGAVGISSSTSTMTVGSGTGNVEVLAVSGEIDLSAQDVDINALNSITLEAQAASNFTVDGADLTLSTATSGTVDITSAADIQMTFATNTAAAMVVDDGTNNFLTFDSTTADQAVEVNQFLDVTGSGAGITLTAGAAITAGAVVTIETTTGDVILADSNSTTLDGLAIGIAATAASAAADVRVFTVPGSLVAVNFATPPAAADNGRPVYVSPTAGQGTLTAPTSSGNVIYVVGILQGADGANTSPNVVYLPQYIALRP